MKANFKARLARITAQFQPPSRVIVISGNLAELDRREAEMKANGELFPTDLLVRINKRIHVDE